MEFLADMTVGSWMAVIAGIVFAGFIVKRVRDSKKNKTDGSGGTGGVGGGTRPNMREK